MVERILTRARADGRTRPQVQRAKSNAFTREKQKTFLAMLAATANVRVSREAAGVSDATIYRARQRSAEFRAEWLAALDEAYERLELMLLDRAMNGAATGTEKGAKQTAATERLSNIEAMRLLKVHQDAVQTRRARAAAIAVEDTPEEVRARLEAKLIAMSARLKADR